ncbi:hypothetical protein BJX64DRAFT_5920 [Aspergillus heterothallicus]
MLATITLSAMTLVGYYQSRPTPKRSGWEEVLPSAWLRERETVHGLTGIIDLLWIAPLCVLTYWTAETIAAHYGRDKVFRMVNQKFSALTAGTQVQPDMSKELREDQSNIHPQVKKSDKEMAGMSTGASERRDNQVQNNGSSSIHLKSQAGAPAIAQAQNMAPAPAQAQAPTQVEAIPQGRDHLQGWSSIKPRKAIDTQSHALQHTQRFIYSHGHRFPAVVIVTNTPIIGDISEVLSEDGSEGCLEVIHNIAIGVVPHAVLDVISGSVTKLPPYVGHNTRESVSQKRMSDLEKF